MSVRLEVYGKYALFTRPEFKTERVSYDMITPSAARGLIESIYWNPAISYTIDRIFLLAPIKHANMRRNEVKSTASAVFALAAIKNGSLPAPIYASQEVQQRAALLLQDVRYVIEAHFDLTPKAASVEYPWKFQSILTRRIRKGQYYSQPYFGCREFPAYFRLWEEKTVPTIPLTTDLGYMLYDIDYSDKTDIRPLFFHARLENGVLDLRNCEVLS